MESEIKKLDYQQFLWNVFSIAWHRKFWLFVPVLIGGLVSIYLIKTLPKIYESSTFILVEGQKIPQNIVKSAVTGTAQDRLSTIKQQILSRSFLSKIIEKFGLYETDDPSKSLRDGAKINKIRENIVVATKGRKRLESFSISFKGEDPETVMNVTNELASLVMEENLKIREEFVEGAIEFLNVELDRLKKELENQEGRIGEYKRVHLGELPEQLDSNLRALDRFQANLETTQVSKKIIQDRVIDLERMLERAKQEIITNKLRIQQGLPTATVEEIPLLAGSPLEHRLAERKEALLELLTEYSEDYPDVAILRRNIATLEKQVASLRENQSVVSRSDNKTSLELQGDSALASSISDSVFTLRRQLAKANQELDDLMKKEREIQNKIQEYEHRVENIPKREQEMVIMSRDYDNIATNYQALMNKKLSANISENLEKRQKGEQFRVIDSANFPEKPISPNKLNIALIGIVGGLGLGGALVFCREQLDNSIRNSEEVERITSVLVLAEIPDFSATFTKNKDVVDLEKFADRKKRLRSKGMNA